MPSIWDRGTSVWKRWPLPSLALAGGVAFIVLGPHLPWGRETIRVDARTVDAIVARRASVQGRELTADERAHAIGDYVREEILVREALRNGWHLENGRVRQRLVGALRARLSERLPEPSTAQLRAYYRANADRYRVPTSVTWSHVYFDKESVLPASAPDFVRSLARDVDFRSMGDVFPLGSTMVRQTRHQLEGALGSAFAEAVFVLEPDAWAGPIASNRGVHFVRVDERHPSVLPEPETVERFVRADWATERRTEILERRMSRIRERYTVTQP